MDLEEVKTQAAVVSVWGNNLQREFAAMEAAIIESGRLYVAIDTEFPGCVFKSTASTRESSPEDAYAVVKANVDAMKLIQLGFTVWDGYSSSLFTWEFNFKNFDPCSDLHSSDSIELLKEHGIDFEKNQREGVDVAEFAALMRRSRLVGNATYIRWITFHGQYDFAYLMDILRGEEALLPETLEEFMGDLKELFGNAIYDVKYILRHCGDGGLHYYGLEKIAGILNVKRVVGQSHQAGSDSLLTCLVFFAVWKTYFDVSDNNMIMKHNGFLFGLESSNTTVFTNNIHPPSQSPPPSSSSPSPSPHRPIVVRRMMIPLGPPTPPFAAPRILIGPPPPALISGPSLPMLPLATPPVLSRPPTSSPLQLQSPTYAVRRMMSPRSLFPPPGILMSSPPPLPGRPLEFEV